MTLTDDDVRAIDAAARLLARHGMLATEFVDGMWTLPGEAEPDAVVTSHDTGWTWWARGKMGDDGSYEGARAAAGEALRRLVGR